MLFLRCTSLTSVDLHSATSIGEAAFAYCANLKTVIIRTTSTICEVALNSFGETPIMQGAGNIYVPASMYEYYRAGYEEPLEELMPGFFSILFRKIEDYPEVCGEN
jgi:hypothetical protein